MAKQKHIPIRTCIALRVRLPKNELIRLVYNVDQDRVEVDLRDKINGRGANISPTLEAFDQMQKHKALPRALKLERPITPQEYMDLRERFAKAIAEKTFRPSNKSIKIRVQKSDLQKNQ